MNGMDLYYHAEFSRAHYCMILGPKNFNGSLYLSLKLKSKTLILDQSLI